MQAVCTIEFVVLQRVDDVEADQPEDDGSGQNEGEKGALLQHQPAVFNREKVQAALDRQPGANRGQRQGNAEIDMSEIGKALGQRIETDLEERHGCQVKA